MNINNVKANYLTSPACFMEMIQWC